MSGKAIATIYFYIISVGSIILLVVGIFNTANFIVNSTQFELYPLRWSGVSNCEFASDGRYYGGDPVPAIKTVPIEGGVQVASPSAQELEKAKVLCLKNEEVDRKQHKVDDIKNSITFTLVGIVLFLIHFPQARKRS